MHLTSTQTLDGALTERRFVLDGVPGILWTPPVAPAPLLLLGHPGGLDALRPRLLARARRAAEFGIASAALELPGSGDRPRIDDLERARADLRRAQGQPGGDLAARLVVPLVDRAAPEWIAATDALLGLDGLAGGVAWSGGLLALGVRLAVTDPRVVALGLFAGSIIPDDSFAEASRVTVPAHVLLQWDDEGNDRQRALDLFDALGSREKTLQANLGGHRGVPDFAADDATRFFVRHLCPADRERERQG